jgi:hypothetical protein
MPYCGRPTGAAQLVPSVGYRVFAPSTPQAAKKAENSVALLPAGFPSMRPLYREVVSRLEGAVQGRPVVVVLCGKVGFRGKGREMAGVPGGIPDVFGAAERAGALVGKRAECPKSLYPTEGVLEGDGFKRVVAALKEGLGV